MGMRRVDVCKSLGKDSSDGAQTCIQVGSTDFHARVSKVGVKFKWQLRRVHPISTTPLPAYSG